MFERILVPTDFSVATDRVLVAARAIAGRYGSTIHLIHVDEEKARGIHSSSDLIHFMNDVDTRRREWMEQLAADLGQEGYDVELARLDGVASEEILEYAETHESQLIVIGTRGEGPLVTLNGRAA